MEMCYDGALVMPSNYAVMNEEEMTYVEGGNATLSMKRAYLNKNTCLAEASNLLTRGIVTGMTQMQIAQEIYAHAFIKYKFDSLPSWVSQMPIARSAYKSVNNGIDIEDGGDKRVGYMQLYAIVWNF